MGHKTFECKRVMIEKRYFRIADRKRTTLRLRATPMAYVFNHVFDHVICHAAAAWGVFGNNAKRTLV
jgi:hypothetical protein